MSANLPGSHHPTLTAQRRRRPTFRNPWGVDYTTAKRHGYPLPALTRFEELELDVAELWRDLDLAIGLALADDVR